MPTEELELEFVSNEDLVVRINDRLRSHEGYLADLRIDKVEGHFLPADGTMTMGPVRPNTGALDRTMPTMTEAQIDAEIQRISEKISSLRARRAELTA